MKDINPTFNYELADLDRRTWVDQVEELAENFGSAEPIGPNYSALLIDAGRTLLVTFESIATVQKFNDYNAPMGWTFVQSHGWSSLTLLAEDEVDWYRDEAVFGYFDRLIDDGFFDDFDTVLFYGAGAAGYAAATYSVAAPDARVLLVQPQASLDPTLARWDGRYPQARRQDFASRFGYAPMMVETASQVSIIHDPSVIEDAMHASLFIGENTRHYSCAYLGPKAQRSLQTMDILPDLIEKAMEGTLTDASFADLWRTRRTHTPYLRTVLHRLEATGRHDRMLARLCRKISTTNKSPFFSKKLAQLEARGVVI